MTADLDGSAVLPQPANAPPPDRTIRILGPAPGGIVSLRDACLPVPPDVRPARLTHAASAGERLAAEVFSRSDESTVAVALDQVSVAALWYAVKTYPEVLAVNGVEAADRVIAQLRAGRSAADLLAVPSFSPAGVLEEAGLNALGADQEAVVRVVRDSSAVAWLTFDSAAGITVDVTALGPGEQLAVEQEALRKSAPGTGAARQLIIGPANYAGQGRAWARAVNTYVDGCDARNVYVHSRSSRFLFEADMPISTSDWQNAVPRLGIARDFIGRATHIMFEAGRPIVGARSSVMTDPESPHLTLGDVESFLEAGKHVAFLFHGSDIRDPRLHRQIDAWSPFRDGLNDALAEVLINRVDRSLALLDKYHAVTFVSTLDLLDHVPGAVWLPVVADHRSFVPSPAALTGGIPVVAHAPTNSTLKGSQWIDPILERLDREGTIKYRRFRGIPSLAVPDALRGVDVLVDQIVLGNPGVLAAQAMAAGRLVVGHLTEAVRRRFPSPPPVVEANPATLEGVVRDIVASPELFAHVAEAGRSFAREFHDGRYSARVLARNFL